MAGDTFDAGTVYAEARLGRDEIQRDLAQLRRDLAKFERDARVTITPKLDNAQVKTGTEQAKKWLQSLSDFKATPHVDLTGADQVKAQTALIKKDLGDLGRTTARPKVVVDVKKSRADLKKLAGDMGEAWEKAGTKVLGIVKPIGLATAGVGAFAAASWTAVAALQVVQTASGALFLLPGVLAAGAATVATLTIGLHGVGDALKAAASGDAEKLNKALAGLAPNARAFVLEIQKLTPAWRDMRLDVQDALFVGLSGTIAALAHDYVPVLGEGLTAVAAELNIAGHGIADFLTRGQSVGIVAAIFLNVRAAMAATRDTGAGIVSMLLNIADVGAAFLPGLAAAFNGVVQSAAAWVATARASGELTDIIRRGLDTLLAIGQTVVSVFGIIGGILRAAGVDGVGLAESLAAIVGRWEAWVNSVQGQQALAQFFALARDTAAALLPLLVAVVAAAGGLVATLLPAVPPLVTGLSDVLASTAPLLGAFTELAAVVLPALGAGLSFLSPVLGPLAAVILGVVAALNVYKATVAVVEAVTKTWAVAQAILNGTFALNPIGLVVTIVIALAAALVYAWNHSETFRNVVTAAWEGIKAAAAAAWSFLQGVFAALVSAGQTVGAALATAWSAASTAFQVAVDAVAAAATWVGGVLASAWDAGVAAFQAVAAAATWLWQNVLSPVFNAISLAARVLIAVIVTVLVTPWVIAFNLLSAAATWLWDNAIQPVFSAIGGFIADTWNNAIQPALAAAAAFLTGVFSDAWTWTRDAAIGAWQAIQDGLAAAWAWILANVWQPIVDYVIGPLVTAFNASRDAVVAAWQVVQDALAAAWAFLRDTVITPLINILTFNLVAAFNSYRDLSTAAWNAVNDALAAAWAWLQANVFQPIADWLTATFSGAFSTFRDTATAAWNAVRDALGAVWAAIRDNVFQPLVDFVTKTVPGAFNTAVDAIGRAWDAVKKAVRDPIDAVINVVYNNGIVKVWNWVAGLVGLDSLQEYHLPAFAAGGPITGGTPGKDSVLAALMPGEYVLSKPAVDAAGGTGAVERMHRRLRGAHPGTGGGATLLSLLGIPGFASGGPVEQTDSSGLSLGGLWDAVTGGIGQITGMFSSTKWGQMAIGMVKTWADRLWPALLDKVTGWFTSLFGGGGGTAVPAGPVRDVVQATAAQFGWGSGPEWDALTWIIGRESGWNPNAQNPTSTAFGLFQFLDGTWSSTGIAKTSDPSLQALAGMRYIASRYGDPLGARDFWQRNGWYDQGGMLPVGTSVVHNGTGKPEPVLTTEQWRAITSAPRAPSAADPRPGGGEIGQLARTMTEVRDLLQRGGVGATVNINGAQGSPQENARAAVLQLKLR